MYLTIRWKQHGTSLKNVRAKVQIICLHSFKNDNAEVLPDKAAGAFNNHFLNITESLIMQNVKDNPPTWFLRDSHPSGFPPMNIIPVTEADIKSIINSLKSQSSSHYDEILSKILK